MNKIDQLRYSEIRGGLRVRLMDAQIHAEELKNAISRPVGCGYVLAAYLELPEAFMGGGVVTVPREFAELCGVDERTILSDAMEGSCAMSFPRLTPIENVLFGDEPMNLLTGDQMPEDAQLLVLTTEDGILGASTLFYPEMTDRVARIVGGNYYVLPSSIHEVLIMPEGGRMSPAEMAQMVREVNETEVLPKERLGNRVLHYREDLHLLQVAADMDRDLSSREERS